MIWGTEGDPWVQCVRLKFEVLEGLNKVWIEARLGAEPE